MGKTGVVSLALLVVSIAFARVAFGWEAVLTMQERLERRLAPVVKQFDPRAMLFVNIKVKQLESELPATPFLYHDYILEGSGGEAIVERVDILLYSDLKELPPSFRPLVREVTGALAKLTLIRLRPMPSDLTAKPTEGEKGRDIAAHSPAEVKTPPTTRPGIAALIGGPRFSRAAVVAIGLLLLVVAAGVWQTFWLRSRQLQETLEM